MRHTYLSPSLRLLAALAAALLALAAACDGDSAAGDGAGGSGGAGGGGGSGGGGALGPEPLPFEPAGPGAAPDPSTFGPYPVGVRTVVLEDLNRENADGTPRTLVTEIWYPAVEAARGQPGATYDILDVITEEQRAMVGEMVVPKLETIAVRDAEVRRDEEPFPVVVFSHGHGGVRWQSTYYTVTMASHGYVVVSPDHQGGTLAELVRDQLANTAAGLDFRPADVSFLIDWLTALPPSDPLHGNVDLARIGVTGHSFGALTALRVAALDPRVRAIVPQAPPSADICWLGLATPVILGIPVQVQAGHLDRTLGWDENVATTWDLLQRPRYLLDVVTGGHFTFSDLCAFDLARLAETVGIAAEGLDVGEVLDDGCGPEAPPASVAQPLINHFGIGFFNAELRGSDGTRALLDQAHAESFGDGVAVYTADP